MNVSEGTGHHEEGLQVLDFAQEGRTRVDETLVVRVESLCCCSCRHIENLKDLIMRLMVMASKSTMCFNPKNETVRKEEEETVRRAIQTEEKKDHKSTVVLYSEGLSESSESGAGICTHTKVSTPPCLTKHVLDAVYLPVRLIYEGSRHEGRRRGS